MASLIDRTFDRWAAQNALGRGHNARRFALLMLGAIACVGLGIYLSTTPGVQASLGRGGAAALALAPLLASLVLFVLSACALLMSALNLMRTGKLG